MSPPQRHDAGALIDFAAGLLAASGMPQGRARMVAETLVEADLLGHTTHGLALLPPYLRDIEAGAMTLAGEPETIADHPSALVWDGRRLSGVWLVREAQKFAERRARAQGTCTIVIRRSHHIACLAAYLERPAREGFVTILMSSDPSTSSVAPFGGTTRLYTPDPVAASWPTTGDPVIIDVSMSATTNGLTARLAAEDRLFEHPWIVDGEGKATCDPKAFAAEPQGTILPLGGLDSGHKGYALGLMVEALTAALGGFGRADNATGWGASVFLQVIDPAFFGGLAAFSRETGWVADAARATPTVPGGAPVRLPGERGLQRKREQLRRGVELYPTILPALVPWAKKLGVAPP
jgi:LDH2 family malate/lactate/ureidoglycolate dehydrogenase